MIETAEKVAPLVVEEGESMTQLQRLFRGARTILSVNPEVIREKTSE